MSPKSIRPQISEISERAQRDAEKMTAVFSVSGVLAVAMVGFSLIEKAL